MSRLRDYADMLPQLQAEESLLAADRIAVGTGSLKREVAREIASGWERAARANAPAPREKRRASPETLQAMGIGYIVVEPTTTEGV